MTIRASVITRYDLDLGDGVVLKDAERTNREELTRWEGTVFRNGQPANPSRNEGVIWTHRKNLDSFSTILDRLFGDANIDGLQVVAATDNLQLKAPEPDEEELCDRLRTSLLKLPRERVREVLAGLAPDLGFDKPEDVARWLCEAAGSSDEGVIDETAALREIIDRCAKLIDHEPIPRSELPDRLDVFIKFRETPDAEIGTASGGQSAASLERMLSAVLLLLDPDDNPGRAGERRIGLLRRGLAHDLRDGMIGGDFLCQGGCGRRSTLQGRCDACSSKP